MSVSQTIIKPTIRKVNSNILDEVLFVGPDYRNHRGGIGAVLESYHQFLQPFHFIPSYQPFENNKSKISYFFRQVGLFGKVLKENKNIKIVHIHGSHRASFYRKYVLYLLAKFKYHKKVIYHIHSSSFDVFYKNSNPIQKRLIQKLMNNVDLVVCLSPSWQKFFESNFKCQQIQMINNVVIPPITDHRDNKIKNNVLKLLFLGRIGQRKGVFDLVEVFAKNKDYYKGKVKLSLGGDGEVKLLQSLILEKGLQDVIEYVGWVSADKKAALLTDANIYILPSYNEGLPISILEAMSYGLPIIATNIGGIPEVVNDGYNGFVIEPGNHAAIEKSIKHFLDYKDDVKVFGAHSLEMIEPYYPDNVSYQLSNCYQSLLQNSVYESSVMV